MSPVRAAIRTTDFAARLSHDDDGAVVALEGAVPSTDVQRLLTPFLDQVHADLVARGCRTVRLDLRKLSHLGPAALTSLLHWADLQRTLPEQARYRIRFVCAPGRDWQRTILTALQCSAAALLDVT